MTTHSEIELAVLSPPDAHRVQTADGLAEGWRDTADARFQSDILKARAQDRMTRIRENLSAAAEDYLEGLRLEDWKTLGYQDVETWRVSLLSGLSLDKAVRQHVVQELTAGGKTVREIAAATGASKGTVGNDQKKVVPKSGHKAPASPRQKAARTREAKKPKPAAQKKPAAQAPAASMPDIKGSIREVIKDAWLHLDSPVLQGIRVDTHGQEDPGSWTITVPVESRDVTSWLPGALRKAAGDFTTLAGLVEQAAKPRTRKPKTAA